MQRRGLCFFLLCSAFGALHAAMVVTGDDRINGTIIAEDSEQVTLRLADNKTLKIPRPKILQIFNDAGEVVWQANLPKEEKRSEAPIPVPPPSFPRRSVLLDFYAGSASGGFYSQENQLVDDLKINTQYSDGTTQYAQSSLLTLGGGASYQSAESQRWSLLISYLYRSTQQSVYIGDGKNYEKNTLSDLVMARRHSLFYGKEAHFYPIADTTSFDLIGQIGYEFGSYSPLATYNDYREKLTPPPSAYTGKQTMLIHGPGGRIGGGITVRGARWQFRLLGFYQLTSLFLPERTVISNSTSALVQDYYAGISLGYGW